MSSLDKYEHKSMLDYPATCIRCFSRTDIVMIPLWIDEDVVGFWFVCKECKPHMLEENVLRKFK